MGILNLPEESDVFRITPRPATFDVVDSKGVQALGNAHLVLHRKNYPFALTSITKRRIVDRDILHNCSQFPIKALCNTRTASSVYLASMTTEILISEVEIISMLIPSCARTSNILAATPAWVRIPTPTTETLAMSVSTLTPLAFNAGSDCSTIDKAFL